MQHEENTCIICYEQCGDPVHLGICECKFDMCIVCMKTIIQSDIYKCPLCRKTMPMFTKPSYNTLRLVSYGLMCLLSCSFIMCIVVPFIPHVTGYEIIPIYFFIFIESCGLGYKLTRVRYRMEQTYPKR